MTMTDERLMGIAAEEMKLALDGRGCHELTSTDVRGVLIKATEAVALRVQEECAVIVESFVGSDLKDEVARAKRAALVFLIAMNIRGLEAKGSPHQPVPGIRGDLNRQFVRDEAAKGTELQ